MPIGQLITLGVGTPSSIVLLDLTGLYPAPIGGSTAVTTLLPSGSAVTLQGNTVYGLGARDAFIYWDTAVIIEASVDLTNWITLTAGQSTPALFIRPVSEVTVVLKKKRKM